MLRRLRIRSAMIVNAKLLGMEGQVGTLQAGAFADLIAVPGDPLTDVRGLENPVWVMKGGIVELPAATH